MTSASDIDGRAAWIRLALCLAIAVVGNAGMWAIVVAMPQIEAEFGLDRAGASLPYTMTMLGYAFGNVALGRAVDRVGLRATLALAALVIAGSFAAAAIAPTAASFAALQVVVGLGSAAGFAPMIADISHWFRKRRGIAVAIAASGNYLSGAVWPLILAPILAGWGWRTAYVVMALAVLAVILPLSRLLRAGGPRQGSHPPPQLKVSPVSPGVLTALLALAGVACCVAMSMPQVHIVAYCVDLGYGPAVGSQMLSVMLIGGVASRLCFGLIGDVLGGVRTVLVGSVLQGCALLLYLPWDGMASLYVVSLVFGLAQGGIVPSYALIVREYLPPEQAGAKVGLVMMSTVLGMALGGWLSGVIHDATGSYAAAFLHGVAWNLLNIALLLALLRRPRARALA